LGFKIEVSVVKLIIQIPCYNEEKTLPIALAALPRKVEGFDLVEWLIIDDGSSDRTAEIAAAHEVDHVIRHPNNRGLAVGFITGLDACVERGADVIVNTDADNQYDAGDIPLLVEPILEGRADMVVGARPISEIAHFSPIKKILQKLGSWVVRWVSNTDIPDAPSGFRALSREAARKLSVFDGYTYTLETIIQAGLKNMAVTSVPIRVNEDLRPSKIVKSIPSYLRRSIGTIIRIFVVYRPVRFFGVIALTLFGVGFAIGIRFLYFLAQGDGSGHIQSLILSGALLVMGFQAALAAFLAELLAANRKLLEDVRYSTRQRNDSPRAHASESVQQSKDRH
jgi:glycosyltransferase involved in cell wall biosynthesis